MEGISDSPLGRQHRPRSSTVSTAGGDSMMKEFRAKRLANKNKICDNHELPSPSSPAPKLNM